MFPQMHKEINLLNNRCKNRQQVKKTEGIQHTETFFNVLPYLPSYGWVEVTSEINIFQSPLNCLESLT